MPVLSMFYGIIIRMQSEKGGKHHLPHIHVICGDDESVFTLEGDLLDEGEQFFKIEPLK